MAVNIIKTGGTTSRNFQDWCEDFEEHKEFMGENDKIINVQHVQDESGRNYFMIYVLTPPKEK